LRLIVTGRAGRRLGGLLVATILTLLVMPALYTLWFRVATPTCKPLKAKSLPIRIAAE